MVCRRCREDLDEDQYGPKERLTKYPRCRTCRREGRRRIRDNERCMFCEADLSHMRSHAKYCSEGCAAKAWRAANPGRHRQLFVRSVYGIEPEEYDALFESQGRRCAICRTDEPVGNRACWNVDHCHTTGKVRGILCNSCNTGIGRLKDDPERVRAALLYLERFA